MIGLRVDPEFSETLPSQRNAPVQPQRPPLLPIPRLTTGLSLSSRAVSELLESTGAGQQGPRSLPHPPGTNPAENPRGEGRAGTGFAESRERSSQGVSSGAPGPPKGLGTGAGALQALHFSCASGFQVSGRGYGSVIENTRYVSQGPRSYFLRETLRVSQVIDQK